MSKEGKVNVDFKLNKKSGELEITLTEEQKNMIPRPGEMIYIVDRYPVDDNVDLENVKDKEEVAVAFNFTKLPVKSCALDDNNEYVMVNSDYIIPLEKGLHLGSPKKRMVFSSEKEAEERWHTLMKASLRDAEERAKEAEKAADKRRKEREFIANAIEEGYH